MKILLVHNFLRPPSGENIVFENEKRLLSERGNEVTTYERYNTEVDSYSTLQKASLVYNIFWSKRSCRDIKNIIIRNEPEIVHFHNTFPLISQAAYRTCYDMGIPVVHTLHHFRMLCPGALLFRENRICEDCIHGTLFNGAIHGCYKGSIPQTCLIALMISFHRAILTSSKVTAYIALNEFCKSIFVGAGIPESQILVKPNFLFDLGQPSYSHSGYALYLGRISKEKGVATLLKAWTELRDVPLKIVGEGESREELESYTKAHLGQAVEFLGYQPPHLCAELIRSARFLLVPSEWYETFSLVVREAFQGGKPVIASRLGVLKEAVDDGRTGLTFEPGNANDLAAKARWMVEHDEVAMEMGKNARKEFDEKYTADKNYEILMGIYKRAIELRSGKSHG